MHNTPWEFDADIRLASTPPTWVYTSAEAWNRVSGGVFRRAWQYVAHSCDVRLPRTCFPAVLSEGIAPEPVVAIRDDSNALRVLSNVCTHRGAIVVGAPCQQSELRCRYHGRRFTLDGEVKHMPHFGDVQDFPAASDHLQTLDSGEWGGLVFAAVRPRCSFTEWISSLDERLAHLPWNELLPEPMLNRDYVIRAHWALYVENYLEGFHIPFVHPGLNAALDSELYETHVLENGVLQIGLAKSSQDTFVVPSGHPDTGKNVAAWYYWLFPNVMINVYPWGVSLNIVEPLSPDRTRVRYRTYVWNRSAMNRGAGSDLDKVEREDADIVESVQRGIAGSVYQRGRYSPAKETGTHHFHKLLHAAFYNE